MAFGSFAEATLPEADVPMAFPSFREVPAEEALPPLGFASFGEPIGEPTGIVEDGARDVVVAARELLAVLSLRSALSIPEMEAVRRLADALARVR